MCYPLDLTPAFKDYLWGGTRLAEDFGFDTPQRPLAEAWLLSVHPDGPSVIKNGALAGRTLQEALTLWGPRALGKNAAQFDRFPMLIKLIDARESLSVQVHPSDEYALKHEGEYGKTEMWYIADCREGAFLYFGFNREIGKEEFRQRIRDNTLLEVLAKVPVKKGNCFFIEAGTLHAIGAGILIAEIQQNSNSTYRVYDFGRVGPDGKPRALHVDKALDVTTTAPPKSPQPVSISGLPGRPLASCKYFTTSYVDTRETPRLTVDSDSFLSLLVLEGSGLLRCEAGELHLKKGSSIFLPAGSGEVALSGDARMILSRI